MNIGLGREIPWSSDLMDKLPKGIYQVKVYNSIGDKKEYVCKIYFNSNKHLIKRISSWTNMSIENSSPIAEQTIPWEKFRWWMANEGVDTIKLLQSE